MGVVDNVREIADLVKKVGDVPLYRKIVDLEGEVLDLTRRNRELEHSMEELRESLRFTEELKFRAPFYWVIGDGTPYCPKCWEDRKKAIHLQLLNPANQYYRCPVCHFDAS